MPESLEMKMVVTSRNYEIKIPVDDFLALERAESIQGDGPLCDNSLSDQLDRLPGVFDADYNGHFGSTIFFGIADENDNPAVHEQVFEIIRDQLIKAKKAESDGRRDAY